LAVFSVAHASLRVDEGSLMSVTSSWLIRLAGSLVACAVIDAALARAQFFRSLWMTRREHLDELREAHGSAEMRSARERVRRETSRDSRALTFGSRASTRTEGL
jgi:flagellar biosynthesis protein FlhB